MSDIPTAFPSKFACGSCDYLGTTIIQENAEHKRIKFHCSFCNYSANRLGDVNKHCKYVHGKIKFTYIGNSSILIISKAVLLILDFETTLQTISWLRELTPLPQCCPKVSVSPCISYEWNFPNKVLKFLSAPSSTSVPHHGQFHKEHFFEHC